MVIVKLLLLLNVPTCPVLIPSGIMLIIVSVLKSGTGCLCRLVRNGSISSTWEEDGGERVCVRTSI